MPDALNRELDYYRYQHKIKFYVSKLRIGFHLMRKIATFVIRQVLVGSKIHICRRSLLTSHFDSHCPSNYPSHSVLQLTTNRIPLTRPGLKRKENSRQGNQTLSSRDGSRNWVAYFPLTKRSVVNSKIWRVAKERYILKTCLKSNIWTCRLVPHSISTLRMTDVLLDFRALHRQNSN